MHCIVFTNAVYQMNVTSISLTVHNVYQNSNRIICDSTWGYKMVLFVFTDSLNNNFVYMISYIHLFVNSRGLIIRVKLLLGAVHEF